jgi:predicted hydrocarbon binding protein
MEQSAQASAAMMKLMFMGMGALAKTFYQKDGKTALPLITEVMSQGGVEYGKIMQQMVPAKSMKGVGEMYKQMGAMMGMGVKVVELSDKALQVSAPQCPMGLEGTSKELCEAMMMSDKMGIGHLLGKEVELKVLKTVAAGDKQCEFIYSTK